MKHSSGLKVRPFSAPATFDGSGNKVGLEAVGGHVRAAFQELCGLVGGDAADGGELVGSMGGGALNRVLGLHVQLAGHLIAVVGMQIVVQRLAVGAYAASYAGGMGSEHRGRHGQQQARGQQTHAGGPLVEVRQDSPGGILKTAEAHKVVYDKRCGMTKGTALVIVAVSMKRIDTEVFPHLAIKLVLYGVHTLEVDKYGNGVAGDIPAAHAHAYALRQAELLAPG